MHQSLKTVYERTLNLLKYKEYIPTELYVFDDLELVYVSIPKVACTSIKIALMANELSNAANPGQYMNVHTETAKHVRRSLRSDQRDYFKFAFVRNPLDRLVSCYKDKVKTRVQHNGRYHFDTNYNNILIRRLFGARFHCNMSFEDFVALVAKIPDALADGHFKSQYSMLYKNNRKIVDYIGHFETLVSDWQPIANRYALAGLTEKNKTQSDDWRSYYTDRATIELAGRRFGPDIQSFGYQEDYEKLLSSV